MSRTDRDYESKSICICTMALDLLQQNKMRASESGSDNVALPKLTSAGIESFNSDLVNLNSIHERTFVNDQAIHHENCFNLYKLGGFLPPTLIEGFVSDKSQTTKRKEILTLQRDTGLTNNSKQYVYSDAQIAKRFRHFRSRSSNDSACTTRDLFVEEQEFFELVEEPV
jgi:hypothetical protein